MCFVDVEKGFDRAPRKVLEWAMKKKGIPEVLVRSVISLYGGAKTRVDSELSEELKVKLGMHQGSVLSPFIFAVVVVVVSSPHQSPRCGVWRVEKGWKFWLPTVSAGDPATKRQLPFGSCSCGRCYHWIYQRESALSKLLYADDFVMMIETIEGHRDKFLKWKENFESKGLKVNLGKSNVVVSGGITKAGLSKTKLTHLGLEDSD